MIKRYRSVTITVDVEIAAAAKPLTESQEHYLLSAVEAALAPVLLEQRKATPSSEVQGIVTLVETVDLAEIG